jgi:hypothetical protein
VVAYGLRLCSPLHAPHPRRRRRNPADRCPLPGGHGSVPRDRRRTRRRRLGGDGGPQPRRPVSAAVGRGGARLAHRALSMGTNLFFDAALHTPAAKAARNGGRG